MSNQGVENVSSTALLHRAPRHESPWINHHLWYHAKPEEVPTTQAALDLISHLTRHGMHVLTLPAVSADDDPDYVAAVMRRANRRGIRILPNVGPDAFAARDAADLTIDERFAIASQWFDKGTHGLELGEQMANAGAQHSTHWDVRELQAWMKFMNDDAVMSICLRGSSFDEIAQRALDDYFDVFRFRVVGAPQLSAQNYFEQSSASFQMFDAAGALPSWNASWEVLTNVSGQLSRSALLLTTCYLPGIVHFEKDVHLQSPSTRHALRMRDSLGMHKANVLIDTTTAADGFIWLINDRVSMLLNFGPYSYDIPNDGRVLMSSLIALPESGSNLVLPPGEVAWVQR